MKFHYDPKVDALYIRFSKERYVESDEIQEGFIVDYDRRGRIIGLEILDASKTMPKELASQFSRPRIPITLTRVGTSTR